MTKITAADPREERAKTMTVIYRLWLHQHYRGIRTQMLDSDPFGQTRHSDGIERFTFNFNIPKQNLFPREIQIQIEEGTGEQFRQELHFVIREFFMKLGKLDTFNPIER